MATNEQMTQSAPRLPWVLYPTARTMVSGAVGAACLALTRGLPLQTRLVLSFDLLLLTFVTLVYVLMSRVNAEQCAELAVRSRQLEKRAVLATTVLTSLISVIAIGAMLNSQRDQAGWLRGLHMGASLLALLLGWIAAQMTFGIQYARLYYGNVQRGAETDLNFPGQPAPVLWDFMYYSFTVAMCYGTTDVAIRSGAVRRLTLVQAVYSFFFIAVIIGIVVSVLSTIA